MELRHYRYLEHGYLFPYPIHGGRFRERTGTAAGVQKIPDQLQGHVPLAHVTRQLSVIAGVRLAVERERQYYGRN